MQSSANVVEIVRAARHVVAFSGAGISVESGIPPFRGSGGLWHQYDPSCLDIRAFRQDPARAWGIIREVFYDFLGMARPNGGHLALATLERLGRLATVITQNIDGLHQQAGSREVIEFHGSSAQLLCLDCGSRWPSAEIELHGPLFPPSCPACGGLLKPDFVFFGELIPEAAAAAAHEAAECCDLMLVVGTSGEVMPACELPHRAKERGATIVEINPERSRYTDTITDVHLAGPASVVLAELVAAL